MTFSKTSKPLSRYGRKNLQSLINNINTPRLLYNCCNKEKVIISFYKFINYIGKMNSAKIPRRAIEIQLQLQTYNFFNNIQYFSIEVCRCVD